MLLFVQPRLQAGDAVGKFADLGVESRSLDGVGFFFLLPAYNLVRGLADRGYDGVLPLLWARLCYPRCTAEFANPVVAEFRLAAGGQFGFFREGTAARLVGLRDKARIFRGFAIAILGQRHFELRRCVIGAVGHEADAEDQHQMQ